MKDWLKLLFGTLLIAGLFYLVCASLYNYIKGDLAEATYTMVLFIAIMCCKIYDERGKEGGGEE